MAEKKMPEKKMPPAKVEGKIPAGAILLGGLAVWWFFLRKPAAAAAPALAAAPTEAGTAFTPVVMVGGVPIQLQIPAGRAITLPAPAGAPAGYGVVALPGGIAAGPGAETAAIGGGPEFAAGVTGPPVGMYGAVATAPASELAYIEQWMTSEA